MQLTGLDLFLWAAGFGAHCSLLLVLLVRKRFRQFPMFTSLIMVDIARTVILYFVRTYGTSSNYFYTFWSLGVLDTVLQLSVVYEMYAHTFRPLGAWASDVRTDFIRVLAIAIIIASLLTWLAAPHARLWLQVVVIKGNFFSSICLCELFVGMTVVSVRSGLPWKTHVARISQGLGIYSAIDALIEVGHSYFGVADDTRIYTELSHFRMCAYLLCVGYWIITLWRDAPKPKPIPKQLLRQMLQLQNIVESDLEEIRERK